mmetsp:Transcript_5272/g.16544  ORF Transcript_5272/g.16544 Transcript_5272/m.16544 type:complete len:848 (-) Transcript_5272:313-2856(-)
MASLGVGGVYAAKPDRSRLRRRVANNAKSGAGAGVAPAAAGMGRSAATASGGAASACSSLSSSLSALAAPVEILLSQLQFTGLTSSVFYTMIALPNTTVPPAVAAAWSTVLGWTDFANLDSLGVTAMLQALPATGALNFIRLQLASFIEAMPWTWVYMCLTCLTPLTISFVVLLLYKSTANILWLFGLTAGLATLLTGLLLRNLAPIDRLVLLNPNLTPDIFTWLTVAGLGMVALCLLVQAVGGWFRLRVALVQAKFKLRLTAERYKRKDASALSRSLAVAAARGRYGAPRSPAVLIRSGILALLFLSLGVSPILDAHGRSEAEVVALRSNPLYSSILQAFFFIAAVLFVLHLALLSCEWGRKRLADAAAVVNAVFIDVLLLVLSLLFTPVARYLLQVYVPLTLNCAPGEWFPVHAFTLETAILGAASPQAALLAASGRGRNGACEACMFYDYGLAADSSQTGTANVSLTGAVPVLSATCAAYGDACRGETRTVLDADRSLDFNAQVQPFYYPASLLMLFGFTGMLIYLYYAIVRAHVRALETVPINSETLADLAEVAASKQWRVCALLSCANPRAQPSPLALSRIALGEAAYGLAAITPLTPRAVAPTQAPHPTHGFESARPALTSRLHVERAAAAAASMGWEYRVLRSRNRARTVYSHFSYRWRYFRAIHVLQKLALVLVVTFAAKQVVVATSCMLTIYALWLLVALLQRPYFDGASNALNIAASLACTVNAVLLLLAHHGALANLSQTGMVLLLLGFNILLPLWCFGSGLLFSCRKRRALAAVADVLEEALSPPELVGDDTMIPHTLALPFTPAEVLPAIDPPPTPSPPELVGERPAPSPPQPS